jgi:lipopolysaccharide/colanic/teichoic acid biosynthesis glycosyltransferase
MTTPATEVTGSDIDYVEPPVHKTTTPPAPPARLRKRPVFHSTVLPFYRRPFYRPLFEVDAREEQGSTNAAPHGSDRATRALNIVVAIFGLLVTAPLFILIALAIKLSSRGPVFYKQTRVGLDRRWRKAQSVYDDRAEDLGGRPFTMYKFRTMVTAAESDSKEVWARPRDERVTWLGRRLRITRLDELPQLFNVLAGDMNIVGPRPERPTIFAELRKEIPHYHLRQRVMPGITGWAQVNLAYDTCVDDVRRKVEFDLEYLDTRSVGRDLRIMGRTIPIMLFCRFGW